MITLLTLTIAGGNYFKKKNIKFINEPLLATLIGLVSGFILKSIDGNKAINNITTGYVKFFLIVLLPPIIFDR